MLALEFPSHKIQKKDPAKGSQVFSQIASVLFVMMMTVMAMMGRGIGRNDGTSQNHNGDYGKKNHAQFHTQTPSDQPFSSVRLLEAA